MKQSSAILLAAVVLACAAERPAARTAPEPRETTPREKPAPVVEKSGYLPEIDEALSSRTRVTSSGRKSACRAR
jgi:hypothetical protein